MSRPAWAIAGTRQGWREPAEVRRGVWLYRKGRGNEPGLKAPLFWLTLRTPLDSETGIYRGGLAEQIQKGLQSDAVGIGGIKLVWGGKHSCLMGSLKALSLVFSCLSLAVSCLSCSVSFSISFVLSLLRSLSLFTRKMSLSSCFIRCSC
jgi:hypothetical protein